MLEPQNQTSHQKPTETPNTAQLDWIEPEIRQLHVSETAFRVGTGSDGETQYSDCAKS